ncbi:MAG: amidase [Candidatus Nanopelagicales bacterium]|nr:amidase [Candidatus Nanopelagicales bacterium]MDZ4249448.1 amidase [Candidatus Nanopelagicales bacterium]
MKFTEYRGLDASAMAEALRDGDTTPQELLDAARARLSEVNPTINAVIHRMDTYAKGQIDAGLPRGRFSGVPFLVKDMDGTLAGEPCAAGSRSLRDWIPDHDSELFARYRRSGLVFLGKTNAPEFGIMGVTEPELFGPTLNPWDLNHTPGGSSGGSAAAVAAGVVPVAHGGDGGGSIRIPASFCGLFGLKPSRGRQPLGPDIGEAWNGQVVPHVLSRSVRDSAAFLAVTHGADPGAPYDEPRGSTRFVEAVARPPKQLRIGISTKAFLGPKTHPDCAAALASAAELLVDLGHTVEEVDLPLDVQAVSNAYLTIVAAGVAAAVANTYRQTGVKPRSDLFERPTWLLAHMGDVLTARELEEARIVAFDLSRRMARIFSSIDIHASPTAAYPPAKIGELDLPRSQKITLSVLGHVASATWSATDPVFRQALPQLAAESLERTPNTQVFNMTGQPAMSVPLYWNEAGLPIGVQFAAPYGKETSLFSLAGQLEQARPWFDRVPPL